MHQNQSIDGYRSIPHRRPYIEAAILALLKYFTAIAAITLGVILVLGGETLVRHGFIGAVVAFAVIWLIGYIRRFTVKCPLCKGTPLLDSAASKHKNAVRFRPLNYGTTAQLSLILSHRFRCMYCGTGFNLMRNSSTKRRKSTGQ
jgi:hypothetical protein